MRSNKSNRVIYLWNKTKQNVPLSEVERSNCYQIQRSWQIMSSLMKTEDLSDTKSGTLQ